MTLAERIKSMFQRGPMVRFTCEPSAVVFGKDQALRLRATFFPPFTGPLEPVVKIKELPGEEIKLHAVSPSSPATSPTFEAALPGGRLPRGVLTFLLAATRNSEPIASFTVHVFDQNEVDEMAAELSARP